LCNTHDRHNGAYVASQPLLEILANQAPHRNEVKKLIAVTLQGRQDLDPLLAREATKR